MDEFAQTRQPDDLFDDEFTPIAEPTPLTHHKRPQRPKPPPKAPSQKAQQPPKPQPAPDTTPAETVPPPASPTQTPKPPLAVRGDRSATGGLTKPKLTEDELSARLAAAKLNNAKREEAHRLAEADEASFQHREAQAQQKRREEGAARRVMDQEREKNRLRKLKGMGGREWDEGKEESEPRSERGSQFRRGAYGGTTYRGQGPNEQHGESTDRVVAADGGGFRGRSRGRGRGERGRGERGGRGRGGGDHGSQAPQALPREEDFPDLPPAKATSKQSPPDPPSEPLMAPSGEKQSWADQVEQG